MLANITKMQGTSIRKQLFFSRKIMIWAFPQLTKTTFRSGETMFLSIGVGLSTISFALQKEGGQKDAVPIPNAGQVSAKKMEFSFLRR